MADILWQCTIPLKPVTKKNSNQIVTSNGKYRLIPSEKFLKYQRDCKWFIKPPAEPIDCKCNIKAIYYMPDRHRVDITNLHNALHDVLVHFEVIKDDNCKIVVGTDGSRVKVDRQNPRTEVTITKVEEITGFEVRE